MRISEAIHAYHAITKGRSSCALRVAQYAVALDVLDGSEWEREFVAKMKEILKIDDPETYILQKAFEEETA